MGGSSGPGEDFLLDDVPLVHRGGLSSPLWDSKPHRIVEQYPLRAHKTAVSVVVSNAIVFRCNSPALVYRLPELEIELQNLLKDTEALLGKLPKAPSDDAQGDIISLVSDFARELAQYVEGTPDENGIHQQIRPYNAAFLDTIRGTAQKFSPFVKPDGRGFTHPNFFDSDAEPKIWTTGQDTICVNEVMKMADG